MDEPPHPPRLELAELHQIEPSGGSCERHPDHRGETQAGVQDEPAAAEVRIRAGRADPHRERRGLKQDHEREDEDAHPLALEHGQGAHQPDPRE